MDTNEMRMFSSSLLEAFDKNARIASVAEISRPLLEEIVKRENVLCDEVDRLKAELAKYSGNCDGCVENGLWEIELDYGYSCPCIRCKRRCYDLYEAAKGE